MKISDRRKNPLIRSGKRSNFERRNINRIAINTALNINNNQVVEIINIDTNGICILSKEKLNENITINLEPFIGIDFPVNTNIIWKEEKTEENRFIYGLEFKFLDTQKSNAETWEKTILLYTPTYMDHAIEINSQIPNLNQKNAVIKFFVENIKLTIEKLIEIENKVATHTKLNQEIYAEIANILDALLIEGNKLVISLNNSVIEQKIKQRTRALLGHFLYQSIIMRRGLEKPRGYAGDCGMMEHVYNNVELAKGFGLYIDRHHLNDNYSRAVRARKNWMREIIKPILLSNKKNPCFNFLNLASGSVRELRELFANFQFPTQALFTCLDQDLESINFSKQELAKYNTGLIQIDFLQENILQLEKTELKKESIDLVYSIGIADYLQDRMLDKIFKDSFNLLTIGGKMIFAYKDIDKYKPLTPNWFCDWNFISRTEQEFIDLINKALSDFQYKLEIEREQETGIIFFAIITKI